MIIESNFQNNIHSLLNKINYIIRLCQDFEKILLKYSYASQKYSYRMDKVLDYLQSKTYFLNSLQFLKNIYMKLADCKLFRLQMIIIK